VGWNSGSYGGHQVERRHQALEKKR
jgi:hypothetical protein